MIACEGDRVVKWPEGLLYCYIPTAGMTVVFQRLEWLLYSTRCNHCYIIADHWIRRGNFVARVVSKVGVRSGSLIDQITFFYTDGSKRVVQDIHDSTLFFCTNSEIQNVTWFFSMHSLRKLWNIFIYVKKFSRNLADVAGKLGFCLSSCCLIFLVVLFIAVIFPLNELRFS